MKSVGRGVAAKDYTHAYQDISTHLQSLFTPDTKDFEVDPVCQSSEGGGEKATSFCGKYQLPVFHKGLSALLALCYVYLQPHSLPPPV